MHQFIIDIAGLISVVAILINAISSLYNGRRLRHHDKRLTDNHAENTARLIMQKMELAVLSSKVDTVKRAVETNGKNGDH